jgi:tRNA 2-thiouridine synthesizing protein A
LKTQKKGEVKMSNIIDARGLSCPQPVLLTLETIQKGSDPEIVVLVDNETSLENVSRLATSQKCHIRAVEREGDSYRIVLARG